MKKTYFQVATMTQAQADEGWCRLPDLEFYCEAGFVWSNRAYYDKQAAIEWGKKQAMEDEQVLVIRQVDLYDDGKCIFTMPHKKREWIAL